MNRLHYKDEDGVALVLTLLFIVVLTALVVDFSYEMQAEASFIDHGMNDLVAYLGAKSAIAAGTGALAADLLVNITGTTAIYDSLDEPWAEGLPIAPLNDAVAQLSIDDEYGKININALIRIDDSGEERVNEALERMLRALFDGREMDEDPVDSLIDWLDSDEDPMPEGAENDYYTGLETPYACKNGPMDSIEELLLIPGITPEVYFGDPELEELPLYEMLTVHGHPEGKVNVNTAPFATLVAVFASDGATLDPEAKANEVMEKLENSGPYETVAALREAGIIPAPPEVPNEPNPNSSQPTRTRPATRPQPQRAELLDVASSTFRLIADSRSQETMVRIEAYIWRDTFESGAQQMFRVLDWRVIR